ncbi:hypothetical protein RKD19_001794 [Streptomyces canus]
MTNSVPERAPRLPGPGTGVPPAAPVTEGLPDRPLAAGTR